MRFEKIWVEQCRATKSIRRQFGARSALDYLIGEKLVSFADAAEHQPEYSGNCHVSWRRFAKSSTSSKYLAISPASGQGGDPDSGAFCS
jgi:hypothetical protein